MTLATLAALESQSRATIAEADDALLAASGLYGFGSAT
jgi:hypothetical protein